MAALRKVMCRMGSSWFESTRHVSGWAPPAARPENDIQRSSSVNVGALPKSLEVGRTLEEASGRWLSGGNTSKETQ